MTECTTAAGKIKMRIILDSLLQHYNFSFLMLLFYAKYLHFWGGDKDPELLFDVYIITSSIVFESLAGTKLLKLPHMEYFLF